MRVFLVALVSTAAALSIPRRLARPVARVEAPAAAADDVGQQGGPSSVFEGAPPPSSSSSSLWRRGGRRAVRAAGRAAALTVGVGRFVLAPSVARAARNDLPDEVARLAPQMGQNTAAISASAKLASLGFCAVCFGFMWVYQNWSEKRQLATRKAAQQSILDHERKYFNDDDDDDDKKDGPKKPSPSGGAPKPRPNVPSPFKNNGPRRPGRA